MAMSVGAVRAGIKTRLSAITGLRTHDFIPDNVAPPAAVVSFPEVYEFDQAMGRALDRMVLPVFVIVAKASDRAGQAALDAYSAGDGPTSVKEAIEADKSLSGSAQVARVTEARNFGVSDIAGTRYYSVEFLVEVLG